jgi:hypothetical protein
MLWRTSNTAVLAILLSGCTMWPEKTNPGWDQATGIEQFERLVWKEIKEKNWKELDKHLASNFSHNTKDGTLDKQQAMEVLKSATLEDYVLGDFHIVQNGDTVTATYTASFRATTTDGQQINRTGLRRMSVWHHQKSGWILIALADLN